MIYILKMPLKNYRKGEKKKASSLFNLFFIPQGLLLFSKIEIMLDFLMKNLTKLLSIMPISFLIFTLISKYALFKFLTLDHQTFSLLINSQLGM